MWPKSQLHKVVEKLAWAPGIMPAFWFCTSQSLLQGGMQPAASSAPITGGTGQKMSRAEVSGDMGARRILAQEAGGEGGKGRGKKGKSLSCEAAEGRITLRPQKLTATEASKSCKETTSNSLCSPASPHHQAAKSWKVAEKC